MITAYLVLLLLAPQDWFGPLLGLPVNYILYPLWAAALLLTGRSKYLFRITWQDGLLAAFVGWLYVSSIANFARGIDGHQAEAEPATQFQYETESSPRCCLCTQHRIRYGDVDIIEQRLSIHRLQ